MGSYGCSSTRDAPKITAESDGSGSAVILARDPENLLIFAPEEQPDGREESGLVVSSGDLTTNRDQTAPLETSVTDSVDSTAPPILRALAQLSGTLLMLAGAGEVGHARAVHEVIGKLLGPQE